MMVQAPDQAPAPGYLEPIAKSSPKLGEPFACPGWAVVGECEGGHRWGKELLCGREWCPTCGAKWSSAHQRRFARLLPKAQQVRGMGYLVMTVPPEMRGFWNYFHSKWALRGATDLALAVVAGRKTGRGRVGGYWGRGVARWHWFGEKHPGKWHPHLNILVDCGEGFVGKGRCCKTPGWVPGCVLVDLRGKLAEAWCLPRLPDIYYEYRDTRAKMVHSLKYITRSSFLEKGWDEEMADELYNFRNIRWWGKWKDPPAWGLDQVKGQGVDLVAVEHLESGECPECGKPLDWSRPILRVWLDIWGARPLGGGYYALGP